MDPRLLRRLVPACLLTMLILLSSPMMGEIRDILFDRLPRLGLKLVAGGILAVGAAVFIFAISKIRRHRLPRYAGVATALGLIWLQSVLFATDSQKVNLAEKIHIIQYGLLGLLLYRAFRHFGGVTAVLLALLWTTFAGTLEEWVQWLVPQRLGEVRDVALNVLAAGCGVTLGLSLQPPASWRPRRTLEIWRSAAIIAFTLGLFFACAHLGHMISDPEIGHFRSRFSIEQLQQLKQQRAREWAAAPPVKLPKWALEDYFLSEAGAHTLHRNVSVEHQLWNQAWRANRILEVYYTPFLELRSFQNGVLHRWPAEQRRDIESRQSGPDPNYLSPVHARRIFTGLRKVPFLAAIVALAVALWVLPLVLPSPPAPLPGGEGSKRR